MCSFSDSLSKGSPLGPAVANIFVFSLENVKNKLIKDRSCDLKPVFYIHCVHDILFFFFFSRSCGKSWGVFIPNKIFSLEKEKDGYFSFSGINVFWEKGNIVTNVYRKKNFSGVYTNFNSVIPKTHETRLIKSLLFQYFKFW